MLRVNLRGPTAQKILSTGLAKALLSVVVVYNNNMAQKQNNEEHTVAEVARYLGRSIEQVRRYLREARLEGYRVGNQWFVPAPALAAFSGESADKEERMNLIKEMQALREELRRKYGYLDVTTWVAEAREGLL